MIPILQFDPSSLSLWYDAHLIAKCRGSSVLGAALDYAYQGCDEHLQLLVAATEDRWVAIRAANIASSVWHEKRHFVDFVLTNYGALRMRQFFEIYMNIPMLLHIGDTTKKLLVPLDSNLEPLKCELYGVGELDPRLKQIAIGISRRKQMLEDDRRPFIRDGILTELGGEAILEGIAYHTQITKAARVFGREVARGVQEDQPDRRLIHTKYTWIYEIGVKAGLLKATGVGDHQVLIHDPPLIPLLYGALAGRFWKQEQTRTEHASSYLPSERLSSFIWHLRQREPTFADMDCGDAWKAVNRVSRDIFGRSVLEETKIDIDFEEKYISLARENSAAESALAAYEDYHQLRCRLYGMLETEPEKILAQEVWADELVGNVRPKVVVAASSGEIGLPPTGFERLSAYSHPDTDFDVVPEGRWWWAATPEPRQVRDPSLIGMTDHKSWCLVISDYAPMAKLLMGGLRTRLMLGPEILAVQIRYQEQFKIRLVVDGYFLRPYEQHDIGYWYFLTGYEEVRCELSFETVKAPAGYMLDPWELRLRKGLREALLTATSDSRSMLFTFWRDWSPWILSNDYSAFFRSFAADNSVLLDSIDE